MLAKSIRPEEIPHCEDLADRHGSLFMLREWATLFGDDSLCYGLFDNGGFLFGGFQLLREKWLGLTMLRNERLTPECGHYLRVVRT